MKALLLCSPHANQKALAHRVRDIVDVAAIVVVTPRGSPRKRKLVDRLAGSTSRLLRGVVGLPLRRAWFGMLDHYARLAPEFPPVPLIEVADVNDSLVINLIDKERPELAIVSGTNLLKQPLIEAIRRSGEVVNLHTGISPYIKGGPNCTNWCLAQRRFDLIGNTVMRIDAGIDSGNLIATERTPLTGRETLTELHIAVMDHAHELYARVIKLFAAGTELPNVPQSTIGTGHLFLTGQWGPVAAVRAVANFKLHFRTGVGSRAPEEIRLIRLPDGRA